jgi:hypothetical protein
MATYFVRADGTSTKSGATDPTSASTSMSGATFNASTFSPGDVVIFSGRGGTFSTASINIPSSGDGDLSRIIYKGEPGYLPEIQAATCASKNYVDIDDITHGNEFTFSGTSLGVRTHNIRSVIAAGGAHGFQHTDTAQVDHYNHYATGMGDQGLSMHDSTTVKVFGFLYENMGASGASNGIGFNATGFKNGEFYDGVIRQNLAGKFSIGMNSAPGNWKFHRLRVEENGLTVRNNFDITNTVGSIDIANCIFTGLTTGDYYMLFRAGVNAKIFNTIFASGSPTTGVIACLTALGIYKNNIFYNTNAKSYSAATGTISNSVFFNAGSGQGTNKILLDPLFVDAPSKNFQLQSSSPCIGAGLDLSTAFTTDITGSTRTIPWDIGPYKQTLSDNSGILTVTEPSDISGFNGVITIYGTASAAEGPDTVLFNGSIVINGLLSADESSDSAAISGNISGVGVSGTLAIQETGDTSTISGKLTVSGSLIATEPPDISLVSGIVGSGIAGDLTVVEQGDVANIYGTVDVFITGSMTAAESGDLSDLNGTVTATLTLESLQSRIVVLEAEMAAMDAAVFAEAVWAKVLGTDTAESTIIATLNAVYGVDSQATKSRKMQTNKAVVSPDGLSVTIYDDDGVTVLHSFVVSPDKNTRTPA